MKNILILTTILLATGLIALKANSQEELKGILTVDLEEETAVYTETYDFSDEYEVKATATVLQSECNACRDYMDIEDCIKYFNICN